MPVAQKWAYFDHAAVAPIPAPTTDALRAWTQQAVTEGNTCWLAWQRDVERCRILAAELLGSHVDELALIHNTTEGISLIAEGFPWCDGDNVVTLANEFPSNLYPWLNLASRGVKARRVETDDGRVDLARLAAAIDGRTKIVSISWVGYASGYRIDLDQLSDLVHARGALLFVDAIQGLGAFPMDLSRTPIDFLAADGHKWLLGPEGAGVLFVRKPHLDLLRPLGVGWHSVVHAHDYTRIELDLKPTAARYEGGSQNMAGFLGLAASLQLLLQLDIERISQSVLDITERATERLQHIGAEIHSARTDSCRSGIVSFSFAGRDPQELRKRCLAAGVVLGCRAGRLRISPHGYVNDDDIDRLVDALKA